MWIGGWTWISQPPWVILAQGLLLWEFNLFLSNSQNRAVPLCHFLSVRIGHQRVIKSVKLLQQKVKREKQSFLQQCSPAQSLLVVFELIQAGLLLTGYLTRATALEPIPAGVHLALCSQLWQVYVPPLADIIPRNTQEVQVILKRHNICVICFFPECFLKLYLLEPLKLSWTLKLFLYHRKLYCS